MDAAHRDHPPSLHRAILPFLVAGAPGSAMLRFQCMVTDAEWEWPPKCKSLERPFGAIKQGLSLRYHGLTNRFQEICSGAPHFQQV